MRKKFLREEVKNLKDEVQTYKKIQWKVKKKMICKEFKKLIKNTRITMCDTSTSLMIENKIVICLSVKFITQKEEQWLENESYLLSEFLKRVKAIKSQLQKKYNQYRSNLYSEWHVSASSDKYIKLIISEEFKWFRNL